MVIDETTKLFLPCGCAGDCTVLAVDRWRFDGENEQWWFEMYTRANEGASLRWRIKTALNVLLGRDHYLDALCFEDSEIQALREFIDSRLPAPVWPTTSTTLNTNAAGVSR